MNDNNDYAVVPTVQKYYAVYDTVAREFSPVFQSRNNEVAIRVILEDFKKNKDNIPGSIKDYKLFHIFDMIFTCESDVKINSYNQELDLSALLED